MAVGKTHSHSTVSSGKHDRNRTGLVSGACVLLVLFTVSGVLMNVPSVEGSDDATIYIRADGSISPQTAPMQRDGDLYTLTGNLNGSIVVERNNTIVDGAGYTVQGMGDVYAANDIGVSLDGRENVVIRNMELRAFWCGICLDSSRNIRIAGNTITNGSEYTRGIWLRGGWHTSWDSHIAILRNNITEQGTGISIRNSVSNSIFENNLTDNGYGLDLYVSDGNLVLGNNIMRNSKPSTGGLFDTGGFGVKLYDSTDNTFYHNNFADNDADVDSVSSYRALDNVWNASYPSGGNYWSCYAGVDSDGDGIGDTSHWEGDATDHYPLMSPRAQSGIHDLYASLRLGVIETLGGSSWLNATVTNQGTVDETDVEVLLTLDNSTVESFVIPLLKSGESHMFGYLWTPTVKGEYNVTVSASPVSDETHLENNGEILAVTIWEVGVRSGDWVKYAYSYGAEPAAAHTEWIKVDVIGIAGTTVTICGTLHLSDGTELSEVYSDKFTGAGMVSMLFDTLSGFVVPANFTGDMLHIGYKVIHDYENDTFDTSMQPCAGIIYDTSGFAGTRFSEVERAYMGTLRTVLRAQYSDFHFDNGPITCYWDKQTGFFLEMSCAEDGWSAIAVETNVFDSTSPVSPDNGALDPAVVYTLTVAAIAIVIATVFLVIRRKRKPPEIEIPQS